VHGDLVARRLALFPITAGVTTGQEGECLTVGGCDLGELAERHGTPLYLYDQATLEAATAGYRQALARFYPGHAGITYAGKAFLCVAMAQWLQSQNLFLDCSGVGEIRVAVAAGLQREHILVHGVNKSQADLAASLAQAGTIVIDNLPELRRLVPLAQQATAPLPELWLRIRPGLAVATHVYTQTGQQDSKFGMEPGEAREALHICRQHGLPATGLHFHQGSHFRDPAPIGPALEMVLDLMASLHAEEGWLPAKLCPGGGWGVAYCEDELPHPAIEDYVQFVAERVATGCRRRGLPLPWLHLEPGRSLVARAGVALYRVGTIKHAAGRRWLLLDGGLADNPRPALYGARYSALPVWEPRRPASDAAWLAGPHCESSDVLIESLSLPDVGPGELIAVPVSGAYQLSMASNYNSACKPAVLWLRHGSANLVQQREEVDDLLRRDRAL
jgi:diaminopimelate decarboxylase